ncbi:MAG: tripartite tricarboxylate transporter permease [Candidatus Micrarchaeota archaeon]
MGDALFLAAGFALGFLGGLLPGLHSNTMISVLSSLGLDEQDLALVIMALFPAHLISSFIPSIFFGIPESATVMGCLPGHRMVLKGRGLEALKTVLLSCVFSALLCALIFGLSLGFFPLAYGLIKPHMGYLLLLMSLMLLFRGKRPLHASALFLLSGILGYLALNSGMKDPFLPLFSGMFALAAMIDARGGVVPEQKDGPADFSVLRCAVLGTLLGMIALLVPGAGSPSQVATFATIAVPMETAAYLSTISSISVSQAVLSLSTSASIGKSRVGATAWLSELMDIESEIVMLLAVFVSAIIAAALLAYLLRGIFARMASQDLRPLNLILGTYIIAVTFVIDGLPGLLVLSASASLGLVCLRCGVERTNLMGAMIIPTLMLLFGLFL